MYELPDPVPFYKIVWEIVRQIPSGAAATYGQIAAMIPPPEGVNPGDYAKLGARWVGDAMNAVSHNDEPSIPWHRVINAKGGISLPDTSRAAALQRARLRAEHVLIDGSERVNLREFGWKGPDADWLEAHALKTPTPKQPKPEVPEVPDEPDAPLTQLTLL